jgi:hypothetical protein
MRCGSAIRTAAQRGFEAFVVRETKAGRDHDLVGAAEHVGGKRAERPGRTMSASMTRPVASTVRFIVSSP